MDLNNIPPLELNNVSQKLLCDLTNIIVNDDVNDKGEIDGYERGR